MAVVSNTSPLVLYAKVNRLDLLSQLFAEVLIPPFVRDEIAKGVGRPGAAAVMTAPWIKMLPLARERANEALLMDLDRGEAEAISLVAQLGGDVPLLLDDRKGRRVARERGVTVLGSAGALVLAKEGRLIPLVRPILDELRTAGLYLSQAAYRETLRLAGE